jgi:hypothetical protein
MKLTQRERKFYGKIIEFRWADESGRTCTYEITGAIKHFKIS